MKSIQPSTHHWSQWILQFNSNHCNSITVHLYSAFNKMSQSSFTEIWIYLAVIQCTVVFLLCPNPHCTMQCSLFLYTCWRCLSASDNLDHNDILVSRWLLASVILLWLIVAEFLCVYRGGNNTQTPQPSSQPLTITPVIRLTSLIHPFNSSVTISPFLNTPLGDLASGRIVSH